MKDALSKLERATSAAEICIHEAKEALSKLAASEDFSTMLHSKDELDYESYQRYLRLRDMIEAHIILMRNLHSDSAMLRTKLILEPKLIKADTTCSHCNSKDIFVADENAIECRTCGYMTIIEESEDEAS